MKTTSLFAATAMLVLLIPGLATAQFAQPLPQTSVACKNYSVVNHTSTQIQIQFDALQSENYRLNPGQSVTYHKRIYCANPAYVVASYFDGRTYRTIGRNIALNIKKEYFEVMQSGGFFLLQPVN